MGANEEAAKLGRTGDGSGWGPRFKPKIEGVIPAKRRLVKSLMLDFILPRNRGSSASAPPKAHNTGYGVDRARARTSRRVHPSAPSDGGNGPN